MMKKGHIRTDCDGLTSLKYSDDKIVLNVRGDRFFDLKPDTDYTVTVTEGKPEPEYTRYFIDPEKSGIYWYLYPGENTLLCYDARTEEHERTWCPRSQIEAEGLQEVTREEAERYIGRKEKQAPEPEKCVCKWWYKQGWNTQCGRHIKHCGPVMKYKHCPFCGKKILHNNQDPVHDKQPEPATPSGYREPEGWELETGRCYTGLPVDMYALYGGQWHHSTEDFWPVEVDKCAVPADWSPLPECRDCPNITTLVKTEKPGTGWGWRVVCSKWTDMCSKGPVHDTPAAAVKHYPKGGE